MSKPVPAETESTPVPPPAVVAALVRLLKALGVTQSAIATHLDVAQPLVSQWGAAFDPSRRHTTKG